MASVAKVLGALLLGVVVFYLLAPTSGAGDRCYAVPGFEVPCEITLAAAVGMASAVVIGVGLWLIGRRR